MEGEPLLSQHPAGSSPRGTAGGSCPGQIEAGASVSIPAFSSPAVATPWPGNLEIQLARMGPYKAEWSRGREKDDI